MLKKLDTTDVALMMLLQKDSKTPIKTLSDLVFRSESVVRKKILALEKHGYIDRNTIKINKTKIGINHIVIAAITLKRNQYDDIEAFKKEILSIPRVINCWRVSVICDFFVHFGVNTMADYLSILNGIQQPMSNVSKILSINSLEEVRGSNSLNLTSLIDINTSR